MKKLIILFTLLLVTSPLNAMFNDNPRLSKTVAEIEYFNDQGTGTLEWDIDAWYGRDLSKFWLKTAGELSNSEVENANIELVYSQAASAYWDRQFGVRHDIKPEVNGNTRNWLSFGYIGTAPYFLDVDARLFIGEESSTQLLIELEREIMLSQRWVLTPELDIIANGKTNQTYREGAGLSSLEFSLRLGYEHSKKFQPFIGFTAQQSFGRTRSLQREDGNSTSDIEINMGLHFWF